MRPTPRPPVDQGVPRDDLEEMIGARRLSLDAQPILRADERPESWLEVLLRVDGNSAAAVEGLLDGRGPESGGLRLDTWVVEQTAAALVRLGAACPPGQPLRRASTWAATACSRRSRIARR